MPGHSGNGATVIELMFVIMGALALFGTAAIAWVVKANDRRQAIAAATLANHETRITMLEATVTIRLESIDKSLEALARAAQRKD